MPGLLSTAPIPASIAEPDIAAICARTAAMPAANLATIAPLNIPIISLIMVSPCASMKRPKLINPSRASLNLVVRSVSFFSIHAIDFSRTSTITGSSCSPSFLLTFS